MKSNYKYRIFPSNIIDSPRTNHFVQVWGSSSRINNYKTSGGFTLIEVLIALTIVSVCVVSVYAAFIGISDTLARVDNYNQSILVGMGKLWEVEEALLQTDNANVAGFSGELQESDTSFLKWDFVENDLENYTNLKEVNLTLQWQQGRRSGNFNVGTYLRVKEKPQ